MPCLRFVPVLQPHCFEAICVCLPFPLEAVTLFFLRIIWYPTCVACLGSHILNLLFVLGAFSSATSFPSLNLHGITTLTCTPVRLDVLDKLVNHSRPGRVLAPEAELLVAQCLLGEHQSLVPHVLVYALLVLFAEEL